MPDDRVAGSWAGRSASMGYQVNHLARLMAMLLQREIAVHGVVPGQFAQLLALYERDGRTPSELCQAVSIEPGTMTKTLQRMERDGLVERRQAPHDGRSVTIHLTERAKQLEPLLQDAAVRTNARVAQQLSARQLDTFMRTLDNLIVQAARVAAEI